MNRIIGRALAAAVVAVVVRAEPGSAAETAVDPALAGRAKAAMTRGLDWLKARQKENGSWSVENYPGLSALGLWAFADSDHAASSAVCERAAGFLTSFVQPDGGIYKPAGGGRGSGGLSTYNTAMCMTALRRHDLKRHAGILLNARTFIVKSQYPSGLQGAGGFGYDQEPGGPRARADLSNTAWALAAMRETQAVEDMRRPGEARADVDWAAAARFAGQLQIRDASDPGNDGGFAYESGGERGGARPGPDGAVKLRGFGSMTYAGLESMIYAEVGADDPRVQSALQWAVRHWSVDENPGMGPRGLYYYYVVMARALRAAGAGALPKPGGGAPVDWRKDLVAKLVELQQKDGSWVNGDNAFWESDASLVTAYAVLALQQALAPADGTQRAVPRAGPHASM